LYVLDDLPPGGADVGVVWVGDVHALGLVAAQALATQRLSAN
jgi:hypothetical protein